MNYLSSIVPLSDQIHIGIFDESSALERAIGDIEPVGRPLTTGNSVVKFLLVQRAGLVITQNDFSVTGGEEGIVDRVEGQTLDRVHMRIFFYRLEIFVPQDDQLFGAYG
jgi:hypothetical protein